MPICSFFKAFTDPSGIRANGLHIGGVKFIALNCDDRSIYGKKVCVCVVECVFDCSVDFGVQN